jgi:uncharacterized surface protein with fasciclin (FAS1) repeats
MFVRSALVSILMGLPAFAPPWTVVEAAATVVDILATYNDGGVSFLQFLSYIAATGFDYSDLAKNYTVFAPTDEALLQDTQILFDPADPKNVFLTKALVRYLVMDGARTAADFQDGEQDEDGTGYNLTFTQNPFALNGVPVSLPDLIADNGVVHGMSALNFPPGYWSMTNLVERLTWEGDYSILVSLLKATDLDLAVEGVGPFTVLAPSDTAFKKLGRESLSFLIAVENIDVLKQVLLTHVVDGIVCSCDVQDAGGKLQLTAVNGVPLNVDITNPALPTVDEATINLNHLDILAYNGIAHQLDDVLLPTGAGLTGSMLPTMPPSQAVRNPASDVPSNLMSDVPSDVKSDVPSTIQSSMFPSNVPSAVVAIVTTAPSVFLTAAPSTSPRSLQPVTTPMAAPVVSPTSFANPTNGAKSDCSPHALLHTYQFMLLVCCILLV